MRTLTAPLVLLLTLATASPALAQAPPPPPPQSGTYTDTVSDGVDRRYSFTTVSGGQVSATLSWDNQAANLFMVLVCAPTAGGVEPLVFGVAAAGLDRTARLEAGVLPQVTCMIGISTIDQAAAYRLNLLTGIDQLATPTPVVAPAARRISAALEARLRAHTGAALRTIAASRR